MDREIDSESGLYGRTGGLRADRIQHLDDALVSQIAAGEVVERPASVVKELIENALDAEATRLRIEIREGGAAWIAVGDDGHGMSPRDARMALERHATSKIRAAEDLGAIRSFGFRGEALPAIASVSRMRLRTRRPDDPEAFQLGVECGSIGEGRGCAGAVGTRVEVADLFANVPARRKFLKSQATEWKHIADRIGRAALALPGVRFDLQRDERPSLVWPATTDPLERIAAVLSEAEANALIAVEHEQAGGHVQAFVSGPDHTRPNAGGLYLFVNGRSVRDALLRHALLDVYRDILPRGRYPTVVLFLTLPPDRVDVNVHPAKWEVRFAEPQPIHGLVRQAVREAIASRGWLGRAGAQRPALADRVADGAADGKTGDWIFAAGHERPSGAEEAAGAEPTSQDAPRRVSSEAPRLRFGELRLIGQLLASYLLVEEKGGLILVDQHAAHERVLYERLRSEWHERGVEGQGLLSPVPVALEPSAAAALVVDSERVARLGFELESFGDDGVVAVRSIPALLSGHDPRQLVRSLALELAAAEGGRSAEPADTRLVSAADRVFATLACHSARRAGDHLEEREQRAILDSLDAIPWAPTCPHGRPVAVAVELSELERRFGRR